MIHHPVAIAVVLLLIQIFILSLSSHERFTRYFKFLPSIFWIYFLPMLISTAGIIDSQSPVFNIITRNFLPASLFLLLLSVDVKAILKLGPMALIMMVAGSIGIMIGVVVIFYVFKGIVGEEMWSGFGTLAGSWTGGSANMLAVKEALGTPDHIFLPMVIVDTIVPYVWMGVMVSAVGLQPLFDTWNRCDRQIIEDLNARMKKVIVKTANRSFAFMPVVLVMLAFAGGRLAMVIAQHLPEIKDVITTHAWTIIMVSTLALSLSFTPARRLKTGGSDRVGYFLLYFVLTAIGAKASMNNIGSSLILIGAGFLIVFIHVAVLILTARLIRAPLFLVAVSCQANIGGVASAPIVAEVYQPGLSSVGLLMAILGGIIGTYLGIITGQICRLL